MERQHGKYYVIPVGYMTFFGRSLRASKTERKRRFDEGIDVHLLGTTITRGIPGDTSFTFFHLGMK